MAEQAIDWVAVLKQEAHAMNYGGQMRIPMQGNTPRVVGTLTAEGGLDFQKVLVALCDRLGLTIDHKSELVEIRQGKPWGGDSLTPANFSKMREDLDDVQEIVMGIAKHLQLDVTVEDGRKVTVTPPQEATDEPEQPSKRGAKKRFKRQLGA